MQNEKNICDALRAVLEKLIEVAPTAEQEWPELIRRAKDALASGDIDPDWAGVCAACAEGTPPERCAYYGEPNGCNAPKIGRHPEGDLAERFQKALEKSERRIAELERAHGNAAAIRAALVEVECAIFEDEPGRFWLSDAEVIFHRVQAALAAPARNCDVGTAEEQAHRFHAFCSDNTSEIEGMCNSTCPCIDCGDKCHCLCVWSQMPYALAKGGTK